MKSIILPAACKATFIAAGTFFSTQTVVAQDRSDATTVNLVCGRDGADDNYYSEITLNEEDGVATFVRRSNGRTIGPDRMNAIFTPTEVQFEKVVTRSPLTTEVFVISRVDLTMTRWMEASYSQTEPRRSIIQCALAVTPADRAF